MQAGRQAYDGVAHFTVSFFAGWLGRIEECVGGAAGKVHHGEHRSTTEPHGVEAGRSDDKAAQTIFEARSVEVHQQADTKLAHTKVGQKLGVMSGEKRRDRFDFQDDRIFNHDVGTKTQWNDVTFIPVESSYLYK